MAHKQTKVIGTVLDYRNAFGGFVVQLYRHPGGRALLTPRTVINAANPKHLVPFATREEALVILREYAMSRGLPETVRAMRDNDVLNSLTPPDKPKRRPSLLDVPTTPRKPLKVASRTVAPITKLMTGRPAQNVRVDPLADTLDQLIDAGVYKVTRLPTINPGRDTKWRPHW